MSNIVVSTRMEFFLKVKLGASIFFVSGAGRKDSPGI